MTGMLMWTVIYISGNADQQGEVLEMLFMWESNWITLCSAWGGMMNEWRTYGWELRGRLKWLTLIWVFITGHLIRRRKLMRPSTDSWKYPCNHRHCFSWKTSATLWFAGEGTLPCNTWSSRFLQCVEDNFLMQVVEEPMRRCVLLRPTWI